MSLYEKVTTLVEEELEDRVNTIINEFAEKIHKKYSIPLEYILKEIPENYTSNLCRGTKNDGKRCTFKAFENGYCKHHKSQGERLTRRSISSSINHTHGPEIMFDNNCPACIASKELIDLNDIIM